MRLINMGLASVALLAGCSGEPTPKAEEAKAAALQPGEYEITATVDNVRSTDKTTPVTKAKAGDPPTTRRACVGAGGSIAAEAFADTGDKCSTTNSYVRNGRLNVQLACTRPNGQLMHMADGDFTADSFKAKLKTMTYFEGSGDYELTRTLSGKRLGDCPAASAKIKPGKAKQ